MMVRRQASVQRMMVAFLAALPALVGCSGFFPPLPSGGGGGGSTGNYVYVANGNANRNSISGFSIGSNNLVKVPNSPVALGYSPVALVVAPSNKFLYVAGPSGINVYSINTNGSLSTPAASGIPAIVVSLAISPDGNWLFGLDGFQHVLDIYSIDKTTGSLEIAGTPVAYPIATGATWVPSMVSVAPSGTLIFAALGTAGDVVFTFNTSTGQTSYSQLLNVANTTSDNALAVDAASTHLYIARSGVGAGVAVYSIGNAGQLTAVSGSPFPAGTQTFSLAFNQAGTNIYAANRADSTISGYSIGTNAALTQLAGSPYGSGKGVTAIGIDSTGKYLLAAANGGAPDLTMYSFDATVPGKLNKVTSVITDTDPANPVAIALTH